MSRSSTMQLKQLVGTAPSVGETWIKPAPTATGDGGILPTKVMSQS